MTALPKRLKWHGRAGQCWTLFSTCTSGPDKGYKTYCVLPKGHVGRCSNVLLKPRTISHYDDENGMWVFA
jgi:hypothetical protein